MCDIQFTSLSDIRSALIVEQGLRNRIADLEKERESMLKYIGKLEDAVRLLRSTVKMLGRML